MPPRRFGQFSSLYLWLVIWRRRSSWIYTICINERLICTVAAARTFLIYLLFLYFSTRALIPSRTRRIHVCTSTTTLANPTATHWLSSIRILWKAHIVDTSSRSMKVKCARSSAHKLYSCMHITNGSNSTCPVFLIFFFHRSHAALEHSTRTHTAVWSATGVMNRRRYRRGCRSVICLSTGDK